MQIVIDIPQHLYDLIKKFPSDSNEGTIENILVKSVEYGTPLPKGHGRLIDADVVNEKMGNLDGFGFIGRCVDEIPTVLDADKEI